MLKGLLKVCASYMNVHLNMLAILWLNSHQNCKHVSVFVSYISIKYMIIMKML
jgi:hypothetical protein